MAEMKNIEEYIQLYLLSDDNDAPLNERFSDLDRKIQDVYREITCYGSWKQLAKKIIDDIFGGTINDSIAYALDKRFTNYCGDFLNAEYNYPDLDNIIIKNDNYFKVVWRGLFTFKANQIDHSVIERSYREVYKSFPVHVLRGRNVCKLFDFRIHGILPFSKVVELDREYTGQYGHFWRSAFGFPITGDTFGGKDGKKFTVIANGFLTFKYIPTKLLEQTYEQYMLKCWNEAESDLENDE
jgi:hypothetical protein